MGKKKATISRKLKIIIEDALRTGAIFVKEEKNWTSNWSGTEREYYDYEIYTIALGDDKEWFQETVDSDFLTIRVNLYKHKLDVVFTQSRRNVLSNEVATWFRQELEQILVMHKMGGFKSTNDPSKKSKEDLRRKQALGGRPWPDTPKSISFSIKS